jgi:SAM-dependent methyltransferase
VTSDIHREKTERHSVPERAQTPEDDYAVSADLYDHVTLYRERADITFYVEEATRVNGQILEVGCGSGRVLIPTAKAGATIVGIDGSPRMLERCAASLERESQIVRSRVTLVHADMRNFDLGRTFALITIPFRPFQHLLTVDDQIACLTSVRRHLAEDGRFIVDLFNPSLELLVKTELGLEIETEPPFSLPDGRRVQRRSKILRHDRFNQVTDHELIYYITSADGRVERVVHPFSMRNTFKFEMEHLLIRLGFTIEQVYADFDRSPFGSKYPGELIFVAGKHV